YYPECVDYLAPIVSPMVALSRAVREIYGQNTAVVFIGPCIAKKVEARSTLLPGDIDAVITFRELREMLATRDIFPSAVQSSKFDPPHPSSGSLFPISRGLLQAAGIKEDLMAGQVVVTSGRSNFPEALREFSQGNLDANLLEVLCCQGCIMGPGMATDAPLFRRRSRVSRYVRSKMAHLDYPQFKSEIKRLKNLDLSRTFFQNDQRLSVPERAELADIMTQLGKFSPEDELNCGACGYDTCLDHAIAIYKGLAETEMCLPYTIDRLRKTIDELAVSNSQLATVQEALMQSEKLASMGQLAAGIAHELNNPLGVVLMYAHLLLEGSPEDSSARQDAEVIAAQADRCKKIVSGLLHFARQNRVLRQPTDLRPVIERSIQSVPHPEHITVDVSFSYSNTVAEVDGDQLIQVFTNLLSNAFAAMPAGGTVVIDAGGDEQRVKISVHDTGMGIPADIRSKIFDPFFTTKQLGVGTGLGLAVAYGIIKMHKGDIRVTSNADPAGGPTGTTFFIDLPRKETGEEEA
ncbi:MAG TPA: [Fe-Fe] hydrogenase large subunit C-terminal domain-containing protein, partial [Oligoflexia bacterium]|nr:[Fe-Fe] hydrogenase large subunit C-terminal domain-containing protein [Oligoflexia bacterium]